MPEIDNILYKIITCLLQRLLFHKSRKIKRKTYYLIYSIHGDFNK